MINLKKLSRQDRYGNSFTIELFPPEDAGIPKMEMIPQVEIEMGTIEKTHPGKPKGTDTVPAWLTPGENVVNAEASRIPGNQEMIDQMNEQGRAMQEQQGGPIPSYTEDGSINPDIPQYAYGGGQIPRYYDDGSEEGGVVVNDRLLDALKQVESGGDVNAVSPVGASGPYQIMEATAAQPGYGVQPISSEDRFDPEKSRAFARAYLEGMAKAHPEFTRDQLLTAYHSGAGNVLKNNIGPEGKAYAPKVNEVMQKADSGWSFPSFISSAEASTMYPQAQNYGAKTNNEVPKVEDGNPLPDHYSGYYQPNLEEKIKEQRAKHGPNVKLDSNGDVINPYQQGPYSHFGVGLPDTNNEKIIESWADNYANNKMTKEEFDNNMKIWNDTKNQNEAYKKQEKEKADAEQEIKNNNIRDEIAEIDKQIAANSDNKYLVEALNKKKNELQGQIKHTNSANPKAAAAVVAATEETEKKGNPDKQKELANADNKKLQEEADKKPDMVQQTMAWLKNGFSGLFSGPELFRLARNYVGSRVMGYDHNDSFNYSLKQYGKNIDAALIQRGKDVRDKDFMEAYTKKSLDKYYLTGDRSDLIEKPSAGGATQLGKDMMHSQLGRVYSVKDNKTKQDYIQLTGAQIRKFNELGTPQRMLGKNYNPEVWKALEATGTKLPISHPLISGYLRPYNAESDSGFKMADRFQKQSVSVQKAINRGKGGDPDNEDFISLGEPNINISTQAAALYNRDVRKYAVNDETRLLFASEIEGSLEDYYKELSLYQNGKLKRKPQSLEAIYNKRMIMFTTGNVINHTDVKETTFRNLQKATQPYLISAKDQSRELKEKGTTKSDTAIYKETMSGLKSYWKKFKTKGAYADDNWKENGWNGFSKWIFDLTQPEGSKENTLANELFTKNNVKK